MVTYLYERSTCRHSSENDWNVLHVPYFSSFNLKVLPAFVPKNLAGSSPKESRECELMSCALKMAKGGKNNYFYCDKC